MNARQLFEEAKRLPRKVQSAYIGARLPEVLADSPVSIWNRGQAIPKVVRWILLGVATCSLPDLELLDAFKEASKAGGATQNGYKC